jgi:hypothetical protein
VVEPMSTIAPVCGLSDTGQTGRPLETLVFMMKGEFRRSAVYFLVAMTFFPALRWAIRDLLPPADGEPWRMLVRSWTAARGAVAPTAEVLAGVLERCTPRDRVQIDLLDEAPFKLEQWRARRSVLAKKGRALMIIKTT